MCFMKFLLLHRNQVRSLMVQVVISLCKLNDSCPTQVVVVECKDFASIYCAMKIAVITVFIKIFWHFKQSNSISYCHCIAICWIELRNNRLEAQQYGDLSSNVQIQVQQTGRRAHVADAMLRMLRMFRHSTTMKGSDRTIRIICTSPTSVLMLCSRESTHFWLLAFNALSIQMRHCGGFCCGSL